MKKIFLIFAISFTSFVFTSCREESDAADDAGDAVEEVGEDIEDEIED